jgi:hypothetical protein
MDRAAPVLQHRAAELSWVGAGAGEGLPQTVAPSPDAGGLVIHADDALLAPAQTDVLCCLGLVCGHCPTRAGNTLAPGGRCTPRRSPCVPMPSPARLARPVRRQVCERTSSVNGRLGVGDVALAPPPALDQGTDSALDEREVNDVDRLSLRIGATVVDGQGEVYTGQPRSLLGERGQVRQGVLFPLMLALWIATYLERRQGFHACVNAETAQVIGERPPHARSWLPCRRRPEPLPNRVAGSAAHARVSGAGLMNPALRPGHPLGGALALPSCYHGGSDRDEMKVVASCQREVFGLAVGDIE